MYGVIKYTEGSFRGLFEGFRTNVRILLSYDGLGFSHFCKKIEKELVNEQFLNNILLLTLLNFKTP